MDLTKAEKVINALGVCIEQAGERGNAVVMSEATLPFPKNEIKTAFRTYVAGLIKMKRYGETTAEQLKVGYVMLASFVSEEDARVASRGFNVVGEHSAEKDTGRYADMLRDPRWQDFDRSIQIMEGISVESKKLSGEFDDFERALLLRQGK